MIDPTLPCIVCMQPLPNVFPLTSPDPHESWPVANQPSGGTTFTSHGQYGSTVFDEVDGSFLEINVCDDCLKEREAQGGFILLGRSRRTRRETTYRPWVMERVDE